MAASGQGERLRDRVRFAGIWDYVSPSGVGPRVAEPAFLLIDPYPWSAPYEELRLKKCGSDESE
jgi:hypothetical protein